MKIVINKKIIIKIIILSIIVLAVLGGCIYFWPNIKFFFSPENLQNMKEWVHSYGVFGVIIVLLLQILQVLVAVIPGEIVQILAGLLYGPFGGLIICLVGLAIATCIIFWLVRKFGSGLALKLVPKKQHKYLKILDDSKAGQKQLSLFIFILFFIPGLPKDIFTYFAPLTKIKLSKFLVISLVARTPAIMASTFIGESIARADFSSVIIVFVIFGGLGLIGILFGDKIITKVKKIRHK